jgi:hypothetical protein
MVFLSLPKKTIKHRRLAKKVPLGRNQSGANVIKPLLIGEIGYGALHCQPFTP